jgi:hypothetical protein
MENNNYLLANLLANRDRQRQDVASQSQIALDRLMPAYDTILNASLSLIERASEKPVKRDHPWSHSMFLSAQFLQGVDITRTTILIGAYHQAANLLKQETEILNAMHETRVGSRKDRRLTHFKGETKKLGRKYGELNQIAHPTNAAVVELFASEIEGDDVNPTLGIRFNEQLCIGFFGYHSLLVSKFSDELLKLVSVTAGVDLTDEEAVSTLCAIKTLVDEGAFTLG